MPSDASIRCPKCGAEQPASEQCARCGIVFGRYRPRPAGSPPLDALPHPPPRRPSGGPSVGKIVAIVIGVVMLAGLAFVGSAVVFVFTALKNAEPYRLSEAAIRESDEVKAVVGEGMEFGFFVLGSMTSRTDGSGRAQYSIPVSGRKGSTKVEVQWVQEQHDWRLVGAAYRGPQGQRQDLSLAVLPEAGSSSQGHVLRGFASFKKGDDTQALKEYDEAIALDPNNAQAFYYRALSLDRRGDAARAQEDLQASLRLDPRRVETAVALDRVLGRQQRWDEVLALWNDFLILEPQSARGYLERSGTYMKKGDRASARADAQRACELGSDAGCQIVARFAATAP